MSTNTSKNKYEGGQLSHGGIHRRMLRRNPKNTEHSPTALWISCDKSTSGPLFKAPRQRGDVPIWICPLHDPQVSRCQWSVISIGSKAGNLALKGAKRNVLGWQALRSSYEKPNWFSDDSTGCNWATRVLGVGEKSVTGRTRTANQRTYQKGEEIAITENGNWAQKWFPVRYRCSIWFYIS